MKRLSNIDEMVLVYVVLYVGRYFVAFVQSALVTAFLYLLVIRFCSSHAPDFFPIITGASIGILGTSFLLFYWHTDKTKNVVLDYIHAFIFSFVLAVFSSRMEGSTSFVSHLFFEIPPAIAFSVVLLWMGRQAKHKMSPPRP